MTERNFETLEDGCWYRRRDGALVQAKYLEGNGWHAGSLSYFGDGMYLCDKVSNSADLILKIEPPVVVPVKRKVKRWQWLWKRYGEDTWNLTRLHYAGHETAAKEVAGDLRGVVWLPFVDSEIEVEE